MRKQLVIFGIIVLLVTVGLSGCEQTGNSNLVSFQELTEHLPKYIGKTVTIEGYVASTMPGFANTPGVANMYDTASNPHYIIQLSVPNEITLYTGMYRITGTAQASPLSISYPFVNVTSAEAI